MKVTIFVGKLGTIVIGDTFRSSLGTDLGGDPTELFRLLSIARLKELTFVLRPD